VFLVSLLSKMSELDLWAFPVTKPASKLLNHIPSMRLSRILTYSACAEVASSHTKHAQQRLRRVLIIRLDKYTENSESLLNFLQSIPRVPSMRLSSLRAYQVCAESTTAHTPYKLRPHVSNQIERVRKCVRKKLNILLRRS